MVRRVAFLTSLLSACGRTVVQLPPLALQPTANTEGPPSGGAVTEPPLPPQVALFLNGRMVVFLKGGEQRACFPDGGATCSGKVRTTEGTRALGDGESCAFTYPAGNVHLVVRTGSGQPLLDETVVLPPLGTFTAIPTEIGESDGKLSLVTACAL